MKFNIRNIFFVLILFVLAGFFIFKFDLDQTLKDYLKRKIISPDITWENASSSLTETKEKELEKFKDDLKARGTKAFIIVQNDKILYEWYKSGYHYNDKFGLASLSKVVIGTSGVLMALQKDLYKLDDYASDYIIEWKSDKSKSKIKIKDLSTFTSGIEDSREVGSYRGEEAGWKKRYWEKNSKRIRTAINSAPVVHIPGEIVNYSNPAVTSLGYITAKQLEKKENKKLPEFLFENLYSKLGIPESNITISYDKSFDYNGYDIYEIGGGASFTIRAIARIGEFLLHKGNWNGNQIVDSNLVNMSINSFNQRVSLPKGFPAPGLLGWTNNNKVFKNIPEDAFLGLGANHEVLLIIPSLHLVAVRVGKPLNNIHWANYNAVGKVEMIWKDLENYFLNPLMQILEN